MGKSRLKSILVAGFAVMSLMFVSPHGAPAALDYDGMVQQIGTFFNEALTLYKQGNAPEAKLKAQAAYFEVFENLEGPIRINISAKKNFLLEQEFTGIRQMIVTGEPADAIEKRINDLMAELGNVAGQLKGGHELKAEATDPAHGPASGASSSAEPSPKAAQDTSGLQQRQSAVGADAKPLPNADWDQVSAKLRGEIDKAISLYEKGDSAVARAQVQDTYFDVFEASGMEARVGAMDPAFKAKLESHFTAMVSQMKKGVPAPEVRGTLQALTADLDHAVSLLHKGSDSPWALFTYALLIIVREGFEAILIITAIIAFLVKTGHQDKLNVIYSGVIVALVLSVITAILVKWIFKTSAASQEVLEGVTMLVASVVLFSVSYWLISKAEAQKWMSFIQSKVSSSLSSGSLKALWFVAFLAVYREGAETVLFYQALMSGQTSSGITMCLIGFGVGCVLLVGMYLAMRYGAVKLPIRPFFMLTSAVIYYMAFVFAGKGVMELIEGKVIDPSLVSWFPTIPILGVYPYWETLFPQMLLVIAALIGIAVAMKQSSALAREAHD
jgi:high-affinity iron transporter